MSEQLSLGYAPAIEAEHDWPLVMDDLREAVRVIGIKNATHECNSEPTVFRDALHERERKGPRLKWLLVLAIMADDDPAARGVMRRLIGRLADRIGCEVVEKEPQDPVGELDDYKNAVASLGPEFAALVEAKARRRR